MLRRDLGPTVEAHKNRPVGGPMSCSYRSPVYPSARAPTWCFAFRVSLPRQQIVGAGGAEEIRTPDLRRARAALSQLSYGPAELAGWWAILDSNQRPQSYQDCALTT